MARKTIPKTKEDFLAELAERDQTVRGWAIENGFRVANVYLVLQDRAMGRRGEARQIRRAMGLQVPQITNRTRDGGTKPAGPRPTAKGERK